MTNFLQDLSEFFGSLSRILGDPKVQEAGQHFAAALDEAAERELPEGNHVRQLGKGLTQ